MEFQATVTMINLALLTNVSLIYEVSVVPGRNAVLQRFDLTLKKNAFVILRDTPNAMLNNYFASCLRNIKPTVSSAMRSTVTLAKPSVLDVFITDLV